MFLIVFCDMDLKLYASYGCPRCTYMKKILDELDVEYEELDIGKEPKYREELNERMGNADKIPVLEKDGEIIHVGSGPKSEIEEKLD
ncbi:hypothetical protein AKJ52_02410 [candidate division MSBL1 archaeon SCGC-AAA382C18]|uniref:Glutaredoxin domain-containing protein n=1 Tax=candidate division MSBL1 archaeon SCGC-AAA382C18 TaxID=1698281 RepID=A0A133VII8_9EURY|nr:hypothetical protein AKJ52_02410 [candidate division MSBL1 archaeon SCGC-AAA382C18]